MKILYVGDSPAVATGFGNVSRNLLDGIAFNHKDADITVIGINDRGGWKDPKRYNYKIYPAIYDNYEDELGLKRLLNVLKGTDPEIPNQEWDVLIIHYDSFLLASKTIDGVAYINYLIQEFANRPKMKTILYTPIDSKEIAPSWIESMQQFDTIITYSKYGKEMITNANKQLGNRTKVIYPGIDVKNFFPIKNFDKKVYIGDTEIDLNKRFVVGYVGRNQWRKDYFHLVKIFSEFKKIHKEAFLYMHTNPVDSNHDGGDILELCKNFGLYLGEDYYVPIGHNDNTGIKRTDMNQVYNMMEVFLSCSMGEGFGLPYVEAMAAGVPVILPENTTSFELVGEEAQRGILCQTDNSVCFGAWDLMRERPIIDTSEAVHLLEVIYLRRKEKDIIDKKIQARNFVLQECNADKFATEFWEVIK